jgi:O-antigen ligase/polysaccharide polymerase Wzy-like membrane protein
MTRLAAPPSSYGSSMARPNADVGVMPVVRWALYATVFLIPLEYPDRLVFEVTTIAGSCFLATTFLQVHACYRLLPWAMVAFGFYLVAEVAAFVIEGAGYPGGLYLNEVAKSCLLFLLWFLFGWVCSNLLRQEGIYRTTLLSFALGCLLRAALPLAGIGRTAHLQGTGGERVTAFGQNANQSAHVLALGLLALIGLAYVQPAGAPRPRWLGWGAVGLIAIGLVQTGSRGGLVVFSVGMLVYLATGRTLRARVRNATVALAGLGAMMFLVTHSEVMRGRLARAEEGSFSQREHIFPTLAGMFRDRPILGWGPITNKYELAGRLGDAIHTRRDAHNILLEVLTASGLLGAIPFCIGLGLCVRSAWSARAGPRGVVPLALVLAVIAGNMSENRIAGPLLWLILGCALASEIERPPGAPPPGQRAPGDTAGSNGYGRLASHSHAQA